MPSTERAWRTGRATRRARRTRATPALLLALSLPLVLAACGGDDPATTPTAPAVATAPIPPPPGGLPAGAASATPSGEPQTLGELTDRINAAWAGIDSFRSVFVAEGASLPVVPAPVVAGSPAAASPVASPVAASPVASPPTAPRRLELAREVLLPDRQRQTERADGAVVSEAVAVGGRIYVRGTAAAALRPGANPTAWVEADPATVATVAAADPLLARLAAPIISPAAAVPDNLRPQELRPLGPIEVAGRTCRAYAAANTTALGSRIDITFAIDAADLPCFVETRSGAAGGRETFEAYDLPLTIEAPTGAIPAASPALPATPAGRD